MEFNQSIKLYYKGNEILTKIETETNMLYEATFNFSHFYCSVFNFL
ncbi:MAG: hypothetical protein ACJAUQ_000447 [Maribacter sp.]|jgi:hypothetical protein